MKQGTGKTTVDYKTEPKPQAVSVPAVSEIGVHQVRHTSIPIYSGRGLEAPMQGTEVHHCGSQGKHK